MENRLMIGVWIISLLISFVPMQLMYKIIGIIVSIILIAVYTAMAQQKNRLSKTSLVLNLLIIGWDLAVLYNLRSRR